MDGETCFLAVGGGLVHQYVPSLSPHPRVAVSQLVTVDAGVMVGNVTLTGCHGYLEATVLQLQSHMTDFISSDMSAVIVSLQSAVQSLKWDGSEMQRLSPSKSSYVFFLGTGPDISVHPRLL